MLAASCGTTRDIRQMVVIKVEAPCCPTRRCPQGFSQSTLFAFFAEKLCVRTAMAA
jgi:hypothetical protein